jgi:transcriptional regulator with XRE-family HTH domain
MTSIEIGQVIREARQSRKLSQRELARRLRMGSGTICELERGTIQDLGFRKIERICAVLKLTLQVVPTPVETFESQMAENAAAAKTALAETDAIIAHVFSPKNKPA